MEKLVEVTRGDLVESVHFGHAVVADASGDIVAAWGDPAALIYPRSSCKMLQALPLVESGAASAHRLNTTHLALACASHQGAAMHSDGVAAWLADLGLAEADLRCGPQMPDDRQARSALIKCDGSPDQTHNNCSGKHAGFLTLNRYLGGGAEYVDPDHPVQKAARAAFEDMVGETSPGFGIDGCSAPNFACTIAGLARAAARMAAPEQAGITGVRAHAARDLVGAMIAHPLLVAGEGRACSELMAAMDGVAVKTGAEGVFIAINPLRGLGAAVKIGDGATRGAEAAITALLIGMGALDPAHPAAQRRIHAPLKNRRGIVAGHITAEPGLMKPI